MTDDERHACRHVCGLGPWAGYHPEGSGPTVFEHGTRLNRIEFYARLCRRYGGRAVVRHRGQVKRIADGYAHEGTL